MNTAFIKNASMRTRMNRNIQLAVTLSLMTMAQHGHCDEAFEQAKQAYIKQDYRRALALWLPLAESNNIQAQIYLAHAYREGKGSLPNPKLAAKWFRRAADQGNAYAQYELGFMYEMGTGVSPDYWEAESWYQKAVAQGFCPGELSLETLWYE